MISPSVDSLPIPSNTASRNAIGMAGVSKLRLRNPRSCITQYAETLCTTKKSTRLMIWNIKSTKTKNKTAPVNGSKISPRM